MRMIHIIFAFMMLGIAFNILPTLLETNQHTSSVKTETSKEMVISQDKEIIILDNAENLKEHNKKQLTEKFDKLQNSLFEAIPIFFGITIILFIMTSLLTGHISIFIPSSNKKNEKTDEIKKEIKKETYNPRPYKDFVDTLDKKTKGLDNKFDQNFELQLEKETHTLKKSSEYEKITILLNALIGKKTSLDQDMANVTSKLIEQLQEIKDIIGKKPSYTKNIQNFFNGQDQAIYKMINLYSYLIHKKDLNQKQQEKLQDAKKTIERFPEILKTHLNVLREQEFMELEITNKSINILDF